MAQSALTVTTANPTPPTNLSFVGNTSPLDPAQPVVDDGIPVPIPNSKTAGADNGATANEPSGTRTAFAAKTAASNSPPAPGAGISNDHEGLGDNNAVVTAPGSRTECPTQMFSCGPASTAAVKAAGPNSSHASTLSPQTNPALVSISPTTLASASSGTQVITCTGTGFVPGCRIWHDNVEQTTTFGSATTLTATVKKKPNPGAVLVSVKLGGTIMGATPTFTWT
jgi:hypothetical protein